MGLSCAKPRRKTKGGKKGRPVASQLPPESSQDLTVDLCADSSVALEWNCRQEPPIAEASLPEFESRFQCLEISEKRLRSLVEKHNKNEFEDKVELVGCDGVIYTHIELLTSACAHFGALFNSAMIESTSNRVELKGFPRKTIGQLLEYIYKGEVNETSTDGLIDLYELASYLTYDQLEAAVIKRAIHIYTNPQYPLLEVASHFPWSPLYNLLLPRFSKHLISESFIESVNFDILKDILKLDALKVSEEADVLLAVKKWIRRNPEHSLRDFSDCIRSPYLPLAMRKELPQISVATSPRIWYRRHFHFLIHESEQRTRRHPKTGAAQESTESYISLVCGAEGSDDTKLLHRFPLSVLPSSSSVAQKHKVICVKDTVFVLCHDGLLKIKFWPTMLVERIARKSFRWCRSCSASCGTSICGTREGIMTLFSCCSCGSTVEEYSVKERRVFRQRKITYIFRHDDIFFHDNKILLLTCDELNILRYQDLTPTVRVRLNATGHPLDYFLRDDSLYIANSLDNTIKVYTMLGRNTTTVPIPNSTIWLRQETTLPPLSTLHLLDSKIVAVHGNNTGSPVFVQEFDGSSQTFLSTAWCQLPRRGRREKWEFLGFVPRSVFANAECYLP